MIREGYIAIYDMLAADAELVAGLSEYDDNPAIFRGAIDPPPDAKYPLAWIQHQAYAAQDTSGTTGAIMEYAIDVCCAAEAYQNTLENLIEIVRLAVHGKTGIDIGDTGKKLIYCQVVDIEDVEATAEYVKGSVVVETFVQG